MSSLAIITPSYEADFQLCLDLHRSVLDLAPPSVTHYIIVPDGDRALFSPMAGDRCKVLTISELLPKRFVSMPRVNAWVNLRKPFPPIRGWIMQQIVKLASANSVEAQTLLLADSDLEFVRPFSSDTFQESGTLMLYRKEAAITAALPRHLKWHMRARKLLGLPPAAPPLPDYMSAPNAWDRDVVLALHKRIEKVTGKHWMDAVAGQLHVSECILYGVFVDKILGGPANAHPTDSMFVHNYFETRPLDAASASTFLNGVADTDIAVMISAKSATPLEVRREAFASLRARLEGSCASPVEPLPMR